MGPANSRVVRVLLYLGEGFAIGAILSAAAGLVLPFLEGGRWLFGLLALLLLLAARWPAHLRHAHRGGDVAWEIQEWLTVRRWPLTLLVLAAVSGGLIYGQLRPSVERFVLSWLAVHVSALTGFLFAGFALLLSSRGDLDPETLTLSYDGRGAVDLNHVTGVRRFAMGAWTFLWLSVSSECGQRQRLRGLYVVPSETANRTVSVCDADAGAVPEARESTRPSRSLVFVGALVLSGVGLGAAAALSTADLPLWFAVYVALATLGTAGAIVLAAELGFA